jgi:hypothetical protein
MNTVAKRRMLALRIILGSVSFSVLTTVTLAGSCSAQTDPDPAMSDSVSHSDSVQLDDQEVQASGSESEQEQQPDEAFDFQPDTSLETGLPLNVLLTPFHWGRLSLLSFTTYEGYSSNPSFQRIPVGPTLTAISALAVYSTRFAGWQMDLQYQPFVWISSRATIQDFAAGSFDLRKMRRINGNWSWTVGGRLRYFPTHSTAEQTGFVAEPGGGIGIGNAFLSGDRNILLNGVAVALTDHYNENSFLVLHANQDFVRLSSYLGQSSISIPSEEAMSYAAGVTWRHHYGISDTLSLGYSYRGQTTTSGFDVNSDSASVGWSHKLKPSLGFSATVGPAWSFYTGHENVNSPSNGRITLHGSLALSKEFRSGGVVLAFARSDGFTGIISDTFHNRYELMAHRALTTRLHCSMTASYIQQQISNQRNTNGELFAAEARYFMNRNWAIFTQLRYLDVVGSERITGPEKSVILGVRWSWGPDKS